MRALIIIPLCLAAACSEEKAPPKAEVAAATLQAGKWEVTTDVTSMRSMDAGSPAIRAKVGDKSTSEICLGEADRAKPPPALFAGEADECQYRNSYLRNGRVNASLGCRRDGLSGDIMKSVDGTFTATGFDVTVDTTSYLVADGDVQIAAKVTGRRTGDCTPDAG
jgi:hypothetical protein